ncbi:mandelate racemase/muconate lactonizing enzyme family protein [Paracoccus onubensis]|uniref:mandelate racemase/muconate lactonizing enzyme family protein n=1 Tax=Paracoccus onubensis TaxID=1675788 RepID=UPI0027305727|nr:mandelate racemase/muconate lactonizing enzyme family protein [Paracoccus onubensis]MDP0926459.1 mandelate racemase/muconate lactonizing enzyme family protein [Paracoccus onubensis]
MKIARLEVLHAASGWRVTSFLKVETACGIVGWSEFSEDVGTRGLSATILRLGELVTGLDPRRIEWVTAVLNTSVIPAWSGMNQHAVAAIVNALLDIKGKDLGVPVHALFGGALRDRLPVYWSHCATYRVRYADSLGIPAITTIDQLQEAGAEVVRHGFRALKTNVMMMDNGTLANYRAGFGSTPGYPELNPQPEILLNLDRQLTALREGAGPEVQIMLDANFNFRSEGYLQLIRAVRTHGLAWLELDCYDPAAVALMRREAGFPIATGESLYGRRSFRPFLENYAMDVAIVDVLWNGVLEGLKIASLADAHDVSVAPHNFYGHLADHISAHFAAMIPNFRIMEMDIDDVPWKGEFVTHQPVIEDGHLLVPSRPGWGTDVDEKAVARHPVDR